MTGRVIDILRRRRSQGGPPFDDGNRVALVAEGGVMRGIFAGGMVSAIEAAGFTKCFDLMVGSSAGACALAYLRAGQARFGTRMFYEDLNTGQFIRPRRMLARGPMISIDYLVDEVFARIKRLELAELTRPGAELHATATDIDTGELVDLTGFEDLDRALEILRATARMPLLSGGPVVLDGRRLLDGGMLAPVPIRLAIDLGATHVLAILTRRPDQRNATPAADRMLGYPILSLRHGRHLVYRMKRDRREIAQISAALARSGEIELEGAVIRAVAPDADAPSIGRTTQSGTLLRAAAAHAEARMRSAIGA